MTAYLYAFILICIDSEAVITVISMFQADCHLHTNNSFDTNTRMQEQCEAAIRVGLTEICFTEHFSLDPQVPTYGYMDWAHYNQDLQNSIQWCEDRLTIRKGVELCEPYHFQNGYREILARERFDLVTGSVHNVEGKKLRALVQEYGTQGAYDAYFTELRKLVQKADIDVVAHFDLIKRYCGKPLGKREFSQNRTSIEDCLKIIVARGLTLEVNASTLPFLGQTMPGEDILRLYRSLGGSRITFGSDAHRPEDVGAGREEASTLTKACGFTEYLTFKAREGILHTL
ncbi:histidinol-phosphatase HisJ family protein [Anaerotruncus rubiinfantis]|uniref:histidinol-phosphatase HisJ family protein n=2 Tax=Anaerotruncus rubiinfantis TaxID=1720200 RepID=UPI0034A43CAA